MTENWKPVVGWEGLYEVSDHGNVRSLDREVPSRNQNGPFVKKLKGRELKLKVNTSGHLRVDLCRDSQVSAREVHRLVLEAFRGTCPPGHECCHWDGNPQNNHLSNLRWGTSSENKMDNIRNNTHHYAKRVMCPNSHLLVEWRKGEPDKRVCRACAAGKEAVRRGTASSVKEYADRYLRVRGKDYLIIE